jgi:diguanylate cyclase (GGDEF)-like protein/PAS domain S-box-containing protein
MVNNSNRKRRWSKGSSEVSLELARDLIERIGVGIYVVQERKFVYASPTFLAVSGYTFEDLEGKYPLDLVHPDDREFVRQKAVENLKGKASEPYQYRFLKKNGEVAWILEQVTSIEYQGKPATVGSFMDITQYKRMEEELKRSEERFRTILDEMNETYFEVDLRGHYTFVNEAMCRNTGYSREELIGASYKLTTAVEDVEKTFKAFNEMYRTGRPVIGMRNRYFSKDGTIRWTELSAFPIRNEKGEIIGFRGVGEDVTAQVQAEEALRKSEERYRTLLEEMDEAYYEVDLRGSFTFVNDALCRLLGYSKEEVIGLNYRAYTPQEEWESVYRAYNSVYRTGTSLRWFPMTQLTKDGRKKYVENSVLPLRNEKGEIIGFRGISRDVTERRMLEQKLSEMATHDPLTGLPNRVLLDDRLNMGLAQAQRNGSRLAVMMLDLDWFKRVNDTYGHGVGDQLLKLVAQRLTSNLRKSDTVGRMGGDEFVLLFPQIGAIDDAIKIAQKILESFSEPFAINGYSLTVTTSIGIAVYPESGDRADVLLTNADTAMYHAKEEGRARYKLYTPELRESFMKRQRMSS